MFRPAASLILKLKPKDVWRALVSPRGLYRLKLGLMVISLTFSSAVAGSAITAPLRRNHIGVNTSLFMQAVAPATAHTVVVGGQSTETTLAIDSLKLGEIAGQNQESVDDRHTIHDQVAAIATTEVNHYNQLTDRMNVSDARVTTIGWILGVLFTISQALVLFFHLDKRFQEPGRPRRRARA